VAAVDELTRLALGARDGDLVALDLLVESAYDQVWRLCSALVDKQSGEDLAQETFIRLVRALPSFGAESSARTWVLAIARHVCLDELRVRERRRRRNESLSAIARTAPVGADASQHSVVSDLLDHLEPDRKVAFVLTQMLGLSYDDAAVVCDCPVGTIRSRVARARADLVELVGHSDTATHSRYRPYPRYRDDSPHA
jgi:RNA polymerase sigma-70 factor, ECF subfamily